MQLYDNLPKHVALEISRSPLHGSENINNAIKRYEHFKNILLYNIVETTEHREKQANIVETC